MTDEAVRRRPRSGERGRARVLRSILEREAAGLPINSKAVTRDDPQLHNRIMWLYGNWDAMLRAAGIPPDRVRRHQRWSRGIVVRRIRERADQGKPLNHGAVLASDCCLMSAACRHFASWDDALAAAALDPLECRKRGPDWTPSRVIETIQRIHQEGGQVNHGAKGVSAVAHAAFRFFGSWDGALQAAGLDPDKIRLRRRCWTADEVAGEIRRRCRTGETLKARDIPSVYRAACRIFGSWQQALDEAEIAGGR